MNTIIDIHLWSEKYAKHLRAKFKNPSEIPPPNPILDGAWERKAFEAAKTRVESEHALWMEKQQLRNFATHKP